MDNGLNANPETPTNTSAHKMSSSLKKKLRKLGRYHGSLVPPKPRRKTLSWSPSLGAQSPSFSSPKTDPNRSDISSDGSLLDLTASPKLTVSPQASTKRSDLSSDGSLLDLTASPKLTVTPQTSTKGRNFESGPYTNTSTNSTEQVGAVGSRPVADPKLEEASLSEAKSSADQSDEAEADVDLTKKLAIWKKRVAEKEELLRKLKLVKLYRSKNNLDELQRVIVHWRTACQNALMEYREKCPEPVPSLTDIIGHLQIDPGLVRYDAEDESFVD